MSHQSKYRLANGSLFVWTGALLIVSWTTSALGKPVPADEKAPLNSRVLRSCFAINTHFWQNQPLEELDLVEDIGATWIRDEGNWSGEDAEPGVYNRGELRKLERWVNEAHRRGFKVMVHLGSTYQGLRRPDAYAKYAGLVAARLRGKVQAYHGPNEPYGPFLETFSPEIAHTMDHWTMEGESPWYLWLEKHSELIRKAADAIYQADPAAIMLPEGVDVFRHPSDVFFKHHRWMFEADLGNNVSGLTIHPYTTIDVEGVGFVGDAPPEITALAQPIGEKKDYPYLNKDGLVSLGNAMQTLRDTAKKTTGRAFDVWINEWGYLPRGSVSEETAGAYLVRMVLVGFANNARIVAWHNLRDMRDGPYGLVDNQMRKRPAYFAYRTMARTIGDLYLQKYVYGSPTATKGLQAYLFGNNDCKVLVVWNIDNIERDVRVDGLLAGAMITNLFGEELTVEIAKDMAILTVDGKPQYVVGVSEDIRITETPRPSPDWGTGWKGRPDVPNATVVPTVTAMPKSSPRTQLQTPVSLVAPISGSTMTIGRRVGRPSIEADHESLILDSEGLGFVGLNFYDDGQVSLARGGGNVGVGTSRSKATLQVERSQDATTFLVINNPYPKRGQYKGDAGTGIQFKGYRDYPHETEAARIESKYVNGHPDGVVVIGDLRFHTSESWGQVQERMRITYSGNVGIGTDTPRAKLEVNGSVKAQNVVTGIVNIAPDDTAPDVSRGGVFVTAANTKATAITDLAHATVGQIVRIIGGSNINPITIADDGQFTLTKPWTAYKNDVLTLLVLSVDHYVELSRTDN